MIAVDLKFRRNRKRTAIASKPPRIAVSRTWLMLDSMKIERSATTSISTPSLLKYNCSASGSGSLGTVPGHRARPFPCPAWRVPIQAFASAASSPLRSGRRAGVFGTLRHRIPRAWRAPASTSATMLASASLKTSICTLSPPSVRVRISRSLCASSTRATSRTRTSRPSKLAITVSAICAQVLVLVEGAHHVLGAALFDACRRRR